MRMQGKYAEHSNLYTEPGWGCNSFQAREPAAPDWQALAERRGAALTELLEFAESEITWWGGRLTDLQRWKAARDAGPEAR